MGVIEATKDEELVRAVLAGNVRAFDTLVERYFGMVYVTAYARMGQRETAEDLAQEVFLRAYLYLGNLDQPRYFSAWVSRIARNLASDWLRRGQRASRLVPMVPMEKVSTEIFHTQTKGLRERMETEERDRSVHDAIMKLPPDLREVVMLHFAEGVNKTEIARLLRVHPATVGRHLTKALAMMKGMLEPILCESAPAMRAPRKATVRTIALIGAAALMSAKTKAALAAAAGGVAKLSSASLAKSGSIATISAILSLLKSIPATIATGGKIMGISKGIAITATSVAILVGGTYYYHHQKSESKSAARAEQDTSSAVVATGQDSMEAYVQEVRKVFSNYQQLWKARDIEGILNIWDLDAIAKANELDIQTVKKSLRERVEQEVAEEENLTIMENVRIKSIKAIDKSEVEIEGPVMAVRVEVLPGKAWDMYFNKTNDGWKLFSQHPAGLEP